jgi:hypothetical protein
MPSLFPDGDTMDGTLIFDKSFVQTLNEDELFELDIFFNLVSTPILRQEILADLEKKSVEERKQLSIVKSLCGKMSHSGLEPMEYRKAALYELNSGKAIAMHGAMLIDASAPHVRISAGGLHYDGRELQWDWRRWAAGSFTQEELSLAATYRRMIESYDPEDLCKQWRPKAKQWFGDCKNVTQIIAKVDSLIENPEMVAQELILEITSNWLGATEGFKQYLRGLMKTGRIRKVRDYAPFATSVTRLSLTYIWGLGRGFFGPRRSDVLDLEYLYYSPFCRFFVSSDRLHKTLWEAATTKALFCDGKVMKDDLARRAELRKQSPDLVAGRRPIPLDGSILTELFNQYDAIRRKAR